MTGHWMGITACGIKGYCTLKRDNSNNWWNHDCDMRGVDEAIIPPIKNHYHRIAYWFSGH